MVMDVGVNTPKMRKMLFSLLQFVYMGITIFVDLYRLQSSVLHLRESHHQNLSHAHYP